MKLTLKLAVSLAALILPLHNVNAATMLTGLQVISVDSNGNAEGSGIQAFNTVNSSHRYKLWVIRGDYDKDFINGPTQNEAALNIPLTSGRHTFSLFAEAGNTQLKPNYGLSLYFNLDQNPAINAFTSLNTTSTQFFPDWYVNKGKVQQPSGTSVNSPGKAEFVNGQTKVTIVDFKWSAPTVFRLDRVDRWKTSKSNGLDFVGQFTIEVSAPPEISNGGVVNAASFTPKLAPGSLFSIFGTDLATAEQGASSLPLPKNIAGTSVMIGDKQVPLVFVSPTQINAQVPYELQEGATLPIVVTVHNVPSPSRNVQIVKASPGIFQFGEKRAVVQNSDGTVNTGNTPADAGSMVVAYLTGIGNVDNPVASGTSAGSEPLSRPRSAVAATVNGAGADIAFAGLTPGFVGLTQVNLKVPALAPGTYPLVITVDGVQSNAAMITVK